MMEKRKDRRRENKMEEDGRIRKKL